LDDGRRREKNAQIFENVRKILETEPSARGKYKR
jgi:hypothetical protein